MGTNNCLDRTNSKFLVPGKVNHDFQPFASPLAIMHDTVGKGEELILQGQEGQELSASTDPSQLILKMTSEHQTVDPTNKIMGNDHDVIFV